MAVKLQVEAQRSAWRGGEGGLAVGTCFEKTEGTA